MARAIRVTILYLAIAYALMLTYQVFTQTALTTAVSSLGSSVPLVASWMGSRVDLAIFVFTFAWMFVLSSAISTLIFGNERRLIVQFLITLALAITTSVIFDALKAVGFNLTNPNNVLSNSFAQVFSNAFFAFFYLSLPYVFMIVIDLRASKKVLPKILRKKR